MAGAVVSVSQYRRAAIDWVGGEFADRREIARGIADREGRFSVTFEETAPGLSEDPEGPGSPVMTTISASAPGFGPAFPESFAADATDDTTIRLVRDDVPITGRVVNLEGRPVSGATIRVHRLNSPQRDEDVDRWLNAATKGPAAGDRAQPQDFRPYPSFREVTRRYRLPRRPTSGADSD